MRKVHQEKLAIKICLILMLTSCRDKGSSEASADTADTGEPPNPCTEGTIHIDDNEEAYSSIQDALDVIQNGSTLYVCPGIHYEALSLKVFIDEDMHINIIGESSEDTIIDAQGQGPVLWVESVDLYISDITLRKGSGYCDLHGGEDGICTGGGILNYYGDITAERVLLENNAAVDLGGGIFMSGYWDGEDDSKPLMILMDSVISDNFASTGGGAALEFPFRMESYNTDWGDSIEQDIAIIEPFQPGYVAFEAEPGSSFICDSDNDPEEPCQVLK